MNDGHNPRTKSLRRMVCIGIGMAACAVLFIYLPSKPNHNQNGVEYYLWLAYEVWPVFAIIYGILLLLVSNRDKGCEVLLGSVFLAFTGLAVLLNWSSGFTGAWIYPVIMLACAWITAGFRNLITAWHHWSCASRQRKAGSERKK